MMLRKEPVTEEHCIVKKMKVLGFDHIGGLIFNSCDVPALVDLSATAEDKIGLTLFCIFKKYGENEYKKKLRNFLKPEE